ncbi:UDP-2,3-diacylglucosamine diphosphatase [Rodentibacter pneumotropicus]|uniref:UDP-2,3-diacylglucosamine hydrolase n=1 Tax=Rodentibacter pneumotropicus TaxID=758 RepID=A0A1V3K2R7_9PAST|nr:UDP-2,3-diacylglucosamine diphosphatase [Rodentibacter pneumotropicus]MCQ9120301.1 UDP-2,3-diacylglucosamine diphosphatase [Rodentibacter pneumotropicus]MDC2826011.1 UDP-2,3-diacylglucosamine diphosphatase [Rodentibacter pneumotropicus]NBH75564.1 UDP-2,3-diacylglucosamine diphosphatase [Rodentibacter pneumotropicus]OOF61231.1 UDP-2,3-diacylglucosamine diphosphatase [Rodentibacter pneumotropicus]OOF67128.1 UDP-2,3-diacylglucosamine diphosphatase [Rodentibacter pneumotropicus]
MKKTYFISDLHLSETQPKLTALFLDFMHNLAPSAEAVYILGDLFDFWIGDDEQSPLITQVKRAIKHITEQGITCYFIHGNRDFLIGKRFAKDTGMILLPDYHVINLYDMPTLLCHGDTLCIDDVKYQQFRQKVHQKWRQWLFLLLPLKVRLKIAEKIRAKSRKDKAQKANEIMDVNLPFTLAKMQQFSTPCLIHGHTHREAIHQYEDKKRIVLGDWRTNYASILVAGENGEITFLK